MIVDCPRLSVVYYCQVATFSRVGGLRRRSCGLCGNEPVHHCIITMGYNESISFVKHYKGVTNVVSHVFPV